MNSSIFQMSPLKDQEKTCLSAKQKPSNLKRKLKSKSEINIRKKQAFTHLNQQLKNLQSKIHTSKEILTTIYTKVKRKQSNYENQISKKNLNLHRVNKMAEDYKKMYTDGLKLVQLCVERNQTENLKRNQKFINSNKLLDLKKSALQKIQQKRKALEQEQNSNVVKSHPQVNSDQPNLLKHSLIDKNVSEFIIGQPKQQVKQTIKDKNTINKMKKSHSAINTKTKFEKFDKINQIHTKSKHSASQIKIQQKTQKKFEQIPQKTKQNILPSSRRQKVSYSQGLAQKVDEKKTLYEIYKQRIEKRQKQQNGQKMSWIVEKLKQNIDDLQLIRKKSQIKLQKHSNSKSKQFISSQDQQKLLKRQRKLLKELQIKRQKSKQKFLQIQKNKLKSVNESLL